MRNTHDHSIFSKDFIEKLPLIVIGFNDEGKIVLWNANAESLIGFTKHEIIDVDILPESIDSLCKDFGIINLSTLKNSKSKKRAKRKELKERESGIISKPGDVKEIVWNSYNVDPTEDSSITYVLTGLDVTMQNNFVARLSKKTNYVKTTKSRLKKAISIDPHTGLTNYRHFINILNTNFDRSVKSKQDLSLLIIHFNYFSSINSTHGILTGNRILRKLAQMVKKAVKSSFNVGRFSGTEFAVLMPDTDVMEAFQISGEIFSILNHQAVSETKNISEVGISTSMALGGIPHCEDVFTSEQLLDRVVDKLNEAKCMGGDSIMLCSPARIDDQCVTAEDQSTVYDDTFRYTMEFVNALANTVKTKDNYTQEHSAVMSHYASCMADYLGMNELDVQNVRIGAMLHDLGKIGIDKYILLKPDALTASEFKIIQQHPRIGAEIIRNVHPLKDVVPYVLYHHEKYNGDGYLHGLSGEEIPLGARIISLADVYHALTSDRSYRKALPKKEAFGIIKDNSGTQFDPRVVKAFFDIYQ